MAKASMRTIIPRFNAAAHGARIRARTSIHPRRDRIGRSRMIAAPSAWPNGSSASAQQWGGVRLDASRHSADASSARRYRSHRTASAARRTSSRATCASNASLTQDDLASMSFRAVEVPANPAEMSRSGSQFAPPFAGCRRIRCECTRIHELLSHPFRNGSHVVDLKRPRVLYAASEMAPIIKTGGLADVAGSLALALQSLNCDVRVALPFYGDLIDRVHALRSIARTRLHNRDIEVFEAIAPQGQTAVAGLRVRSCSNATVIRMSIPAARLARQRRAIRTVLAAPSHGLQPTRNDTAFTPDVVHLNDWQTGLVAPLTRARHPARRLRCSAFTIWPTRASSIARRSIGLDYRPICGRSTESNSTDRCRSSKAGSRSQTALRPSVRPTREKFKRRNSAAGSMD